MRFSPAAEWVEPASSRFEAVELLYPWCSGIPVAPHLPKPFF